MQNLGGGGVEAFFVISSFFTVKKYYGSGELSVRKQFKYRISRLYPPYIAVVVIAVLYVLLTRNVPLDAITHLFSLQNFQWMISGYHSPMQPMTAHTWTLSIEVWNGLLWLILLRILSKKQYKFAMYVALVVGVVYRTVMIFASIDVYVISLCPLAHMDAFAVGSLLAINAMEKRIKKSKAMLLGMLGIAGLLGVIITIAADNDVSVVQGYRLLLSSKNYLNHWFTGNIYFFITLLVYAILTILYLHDAQENKRVNNALIKGLTQLGNGSYIMYLFHWPVLMIISRLIRLWYIKFAFVLIITALAWLLFANTETIYRNWKDKR